MTLTKEQTIEKINKIEKHLLTVNKTYEYWVCPCCGMRYTDEDLK